MDIEAYAKEWPMGREPDKQMIEILSGVIGKHGKVLDLGVGDGTYFRLLKRHGFRAFGFDKSKIRAKRAKEKKDDSIAVSDAESACFKTNAFDGIFLIDVLEHVSKPEGLIAEAARILKKGGALILTTPNYPAKRFYDFVAKSYPFFWDDPTHISKMNYFKLKKILHKQFREVQICVDFSIFDKRLAANKDLLNRIQMLFGHKFIAMCKKPKNK